MRVIYTDAIGTDNINVFCFFFPEVHSFIYYLTSKFAMSTYTQQVIQTLATAREEVGRSCYARVVHDFSHQA